MPLRLCLLAPPLGCRLRRNWSSRRLVLLRRPGSLATAGRPYKPRLPLALAAVLPRLGCRRLPAALCTSSRATRRRRLRQLLLRISNGFLLLLLLELLAAAVAAPAQPLSGGIGVDAPERPLAIGAPVCAALQAAPLCNCPWRPLPTQLQQAVAGQLAVASIGIVCAGMAQQLAAGVAPPGVRAAAAAAVAAAMRADRSAC